MYVIQVTDAKGLNAYAYENASGKLFLSFDFTGLIKQFTTQYDAQKAAKKERWDKRFILKIKPLSDFANENLGTTIKNAHLVGARDGGEIYGYVHYDVAKQVYFIDISDIGACAFRNEEEANSFVLQNSPSKTEIRKHNLVAIPVSKLHS